MASNDCGCSGTQTSPPGTTTPSVNAPPGSTSSYGGQTLIPRRGYCGPPRCPTPPQSDAEEVTPYCPGWPERLTKAATGRLVMFVGSCLFYLKSRCSGFIHFDADTEQVSVVNPEFVSAIPQEKPFGFLAKIIATPTPVCIDGQETCEMEIRQELASQPLGQASCGRLLIANPPLCGELPTAESADADLQVHVDYLEAPNHEDVGCPVGIRFLVQYPSTRGPSGQQVACTQFAWMRRLKMRLSDWGFLAKDNPAISTARPLVVIPVAGGTDVDQCYELRVQEGAAGGIPEGTANCQGLIWRNNGTVDAGYVAEDLGMRFYPLDTPQTLVYGVNTGLSNYDEFKAKSCKIDAVVSVQEFITLVGSGAGGSGSMAGNGKTIAAGYTAIPGGFFLFNPDVPIPLTENKITFARTLSITGTPGVTSPVFKLLGYRIG